MKIYDITLPLHAGMAVWPGDTPFHFGLSWQRSAGASVNVGAVTMSVHCGTHADAPFHFQDGGATIETLNLTPFLGPALVLEASGRDVIGTDVFDGVNFARTPRLLLRTGAWPDPARFPDSIPVLADDVPAFLGARGVVLLGLDVPSVDRLDSTSLPIHHALAQHNIHILESLHLRDVPAGEYELIALPLSFAGADGSPVRAVLRELTPPDSAREHIMSD